MNRKKPRLTSTPPVRETQKGPNLSCSRPATIKESAKTTTAMVNTLEVSTRFQPNSFSNGATNTLQAYSVPRARFIDSPPTTRHQRLIWGCAYRIIQKNGRIFSDEGHNQL